MFRSRYVLSAAKPCRGNERRRSRHHAELHSRSRRISNKHWLIADFYRQRVRQRRGISRTRSTRRWWSCPLGSESVKITCRSIRTNERKDLRCACCHRCRRSIPPMFSTWTLAEANRRSRKMNEVFSLHVQFFHVRINRRIEEFVCGWE